jgi:hypothetical protein
MISTFTAFFDANVFVPARLRSLLLELADTGLYRARWSEYVHDEWMRAAVRISSRGLTLQDLEPTRNAMNEAILDCLVEDYEALVEVLELQDEKISRSLRLRLRQMRVS